MGTTICLGIRDRFKSDLDAVDLSPTPAAAVPRMRAADDRHSALRRPGRRSILVGVGAGDLKVYEAVSELEQIDS